jgi:probable biosynthetic protein (TIGR04098 family)
MDRAIVELQVKGIVAEMAKADEAGIDSAKWVTHYKIDSLQLLILRETLESVLQVHLSDNVWLSFRSISELVDYVSHRKSAINQAARPQPVAGQSPGPEQTQATNPAERRYTSSGLLYADVEVGMPLTGRNNLAEGPLLQRLGDLRWGHISQLCGVPSRQIIDAEGHRLYPTFFYVEMAFPRSRPMAAFGENDRLKVASDLQRFGGSMLDGTFYLLPEDYQESQSLAFDSVDAAVAAGIPAVRFSNIFVMQFSGAEWLKKSRPSNPGFERIREMSEAPNAYALVKQAEKDGYFATPPPGYVPMTDGVSKQTYQLVPDRDLNGAGLVYFANYPVFLDVCERQVLASADLALGDDLIDRRTLVRRQSAYLNNASARDELSVEIEAFVENPFAAASPAPEMAPIRLFLNYKMYRKSDGRLMMVSTAEKVIFSRAMEDAPFFSKLEDLPTD